ncbi:ferric reductase-like transmembrane domain-containing protein [Micromonospora sp. AMSO12t]|uniref:ferric reductase-like transmembrane domain-containing protein n=1 Tax=unclassified Micromonospora TaxID=2617518 RepID=UPI001CECE631|nr:ferric reductase-like transmembrane domain-containing protein [Micromonospora sp. AMSO12t]
MVRRRETIEEQMARAQRNQKPPTVRTTSTSRGARTRSRPAVALLTLSALAALWAATMLTGAGSAAYAYGFFFTEFFAGVVALVALSLTVMMGLLATDRLVLLIRHRVLLQSAHRATGILGVAGLVFHVLTKIATGRAASTDAVVPFVGGRGLYVGLGTVAALLMVSVLWTGVVRARFAGVGPKWLWRTLHSAAYLSWPFAIVHGLNAGRPAKPWVLLSYLACVLLVVLALLVRLSVSLGRRRREQHQAAAMNQALAGRPAEDAPRRSLLRGRTRSADRAAEPERRAGTWAGTTIAGTTVTGTWSAPAARRRDPERFTVPAVPEPGTLHDPARPRRRAAELAPAGRRRGEEAPATTGRRREEAPAPTGRRREEAPAPTGRRREEEPVPTGRRRAGETPRRDRAERDGVRRPSAPPRRREEAEEPWDSPRRWEPSDPISAGPVSAGPVSAGPRSGGGRHSVEDDRDLEPDYWRPPVRYVPEEVPLPADDTPTLVDLASRRARRAAGESRSVRRRRVNADAVDGAYWAGLRGEAK